VNVQERYYWEVRERAEEAEINKKFIFPAAYRKLQEVKRCKTN
jgi:hypothetical protein